MRYPSITALGTSISFLVLSACGTVTTPENMAPVRSGQAYQAQYRDLTPPEATPVLMSERLNAARCRPAQGGTGKTSSLGSAALQGERLSRNDLVDIRVEDDDTFNGSYVVSRDGMLKLPFLPPIPAQGRSPQEVEADLGRALVSDGFYSSGPRVSVRIADYSSVSVAVSGAVFEPHGVEIGGRPGDQIDIARQTALGASTEARNLSVALRAAGGIRPDADLTAVTLHRNGQVHKLDLSGYFEGRNAVNVMLLSGDEIVVPSRTCFQEDLMRPTPISPPGVTLFLSNLTQPAASNASAAISRNEREVPYGTRMTQAVFDANCVGGPRTTSANRSVVLFTRDPVTGVSVVINRRIEELLQRPDRDDYDPYLLPGDAIACYDSGVTNLTEVARVIGIVGAASLIVN